MGLIRELHQVGDETPERYIGRTVCPAMQTHGLLYMGISDAGAGYRMARVRPSFVHLLICTGGRGRVWTGAEWADCTAGMSYIAPPLVGHAFETIGRRRWQFCWVYYTTRDDQPSLVEGDRPLLLPCDPRPIRLAIEGLYVESTTSSDTAAMNGWVELVHRYALRLTGPYRGNDPLWRLWADVNDNLARPWTLDELAQRAGVSAEQVRRTTLAQQGRPPMQQVTHLRMLRAAALLDSSPHKLQAIARAVGYENGFTFSTAFKRWSGQSPDAYRRREGSTQVNPVT